MAADEHAHDHDPDLDSEEPDLDSEELPRTAEELEAEAAREVRRRIALSQVRQYGDPVLRMRANEVVEFDDELGRVAERMVVLMHDADGVGLAATQIGILRRIFVFSNEGEDVVVVNPVITQSGGPLESTEEGCLSLGSVKVPVERPTEVRLEGRDLQGGSIAFDLDGLPARCAQHEADHLDGKLIIDCTDEASRREALKLLRPRLAL